MSDTFNMYFCWTSISNVQQNNFLEPEQFYHQLLWLNCNVLSMMTLKLLVLRQNVGGGQTGVAVPTKSLLLKSWIWTKKFECFPPTHCELQFGAAAKFLYLLLALRKPAEGGRWPSCSPHCRPPAEPGPCLKSHSPSRHMCCKSCSSGSWWRKEPESQLTPVQQ